MKRRLLAAGMIISLGGFAQDKSLVEDYFKKNLPKVRVNRNLAYTVPTKPEAANTMALGMTYSHETASGAKVYTLPKDNMPCVVVDTKQFNMPNAGDGIKIYRGPGWMPNAASTIQPNKNMPRGK